MGKASKWRKTIKYWAIKISTKVIKHENKRNLSETKHEAIRSPDIYLSTEWFIRTTTRSKKSEGVTVFKNLTLTMIYKNIFIKRANHF